MIGCAEYRRAVLANPRDAAPELAAHLANCRECPAYLERLLRFERRLERALRIDAREPAQPHRARPRVHRGWLAMAASVAAALVVAGGLWVAVPHSSLAADVVAHMAGEPQAWARTDVAVPASDLDRVLERARMRLAPTAGMVSYAQSCRFRGHTVPHLVVQTAMGPVTVMVLPYDSVAKTVRFDEEGYRGVIVPVPGHGSLAVLARGADADLAVVRRVAERVENAIVWESGQAGTHP
ncbi:MAG: DUF3379 family protein [Steroidobacteraceae bacterium]|jgi:hypothetical protein